MRDLGNHALCGQLARLLEDFKIEGTLSEHKFQKLLILRAEVDRRAIAAVDAVGLAREKDRIIAEMQPAAPKRNGYKSDHPCEKCGKLEVWVEEINDHPDCRITCAACGDSYIVDGPDA